MRDADKQMLADHYLDLYQMAYSILHNETDVEDAVQEALAVTMSRHLIGNPYAYCLRVLRNISLKMMYRNREQLIDDMFDIPDFEPNSDINAQRLEMLSKLRESLPKRIETVFYLYYDKGYSKKEIARHEGISESMVKKLFYKGQRRLKQQLLELEMKNECWK